MVVSQQQHRACSISRDTGPHDCRPTAEQLPQFPNIIEAYINELLALDDTGCEYVQVDDQIAKLSIVVNTAVEILGAV